MVVQETRGHRRPGGYCQFARGSAFATAALLLSPQCPAASPGPGIDEIVVTARKFDERLVDVPLAITAFSEQSIESAGITDLTDIAHMTPGLQFYEAAGYLATPIIRGVAPTEIKARETNAAIFVDGVYVSAREGLNFSQLDIERIEVVKGPQSALYGRNAFSGAINFITKRPSDVFEARTALTAGNRGKFAASGSVSGPVIAGTLKGRIGVSYDGWDGSYDDPLYDQDVGGHTFRSVQGSLLWTPVETLDVFAKVYYSNDDISQVAAAAVQANCEDAAIHNPKLRSAAGVPYNSPIMSNYCGEIPMVWSGNDLPMARGAGGENREVFRSSLNIDWSLGVGTISALTGYVDTKWDAIVDFGRLGDSTPLVYCIGTWQSPSCNNNNTPTPLKRFFSGIINREPGTEDREFSQELRFSSPRDKPFRWSAGGYYYNVRFEDMGFQAFLTSPLPDDLRPPTISDPLDPNYGIGSGAFCPCQPMGPGRYLAPYGNGLFVTDPGYNNDQIESITRTRSWAAFTSAELDFLERWTLRGELRYTWETKQYRQWIVPELQYQDNGVYPRRSEDHLRSHDSWDWVSGRLTLDYKTDSGWLVYTSLANASKSGGFTGEKPKFINPVTQASGPAIPIVEPYDPEKNWTVEAGIKGRTADRRLGIDLSVYRIDWTDIVLPQVLMEYVDPTDGVLKGTAETITLMRNTGDATVWGWELQTDLLINDAWSAGLGVSYTDSTWDRAKQASYQFFPSFYTTDPDCSPAAIYALPTTPVNERAPRVNACAAASGDISGQQQLRVSPWTVNATLQYRHQLVDHWDFYGRTDVSWRDKWYTGSDNQNWIPPSTFVNLRLGVESGRYTIEAFVDNLFGFSKPIGAYRDIFRSNTQDIYSRNNPPTSSMGDFPPMRETINLPNLRTWGLTARVRFGNAVR